MANPYVQENLQKVYEVLWAKGGYRVTSWSTKDRQWQLWFCGERQFLIESFNDEGFQIWEPVDYTNDMDATLETLKK